MVKWTHIFVLIKKHTVEKKYTEKKFIEKTTGKSTDLLERDLFATSFVKLVREFLQYFYIVLTILK